MSELSRIERLAKSLIPRFPRSSNRHYKLEDARNMINEFGLDLTPGALAFLVNNDIHLDDFLMGVYHLENKIGKKVTSDFATIDEAFSPKVYEEDGTIAFTATWKGKEQVFVEYEYGERTPKTVKDIPIE
ncbi:MAG: hypothetical protein NWR72_02685 [Bacteroidia bacterium]|nr:hypothetical protein [Bacteroidia bacterium]